MIRDGMTDVTAASQLADEARSERQRNFCPGDSGFAGAEEEIDDDTRLVRDDELLIDNGNADEVPAVQTPVALRPAPISEPCRARTAAGEHLSPPRGGGSVPAIPPPFPSKRPPVAEHQSAGAERAISNPNPPPLHIGTQSTPRPSRSYRMPLDESALDNGHRYQSRSHAAPYESAESEWAHSPHTRVPRLDDTTLIGYPPPLQDDLYRESPPLRHKRRVAQEDEDVQPTTSVRQRVHDSGLLQEGSVVLGRYRVTQVTDDGAAIIADVVRLGFESPAQIILLNSGDRSSAAASEHLVRTARAVAQAQSEHVARILDLSRSRTRAQYVIVERYGFGDLADLVRTRGALAVSDALDYAVQIADALVECHGFGVMHGSLRPSRVFITEAADGTPLVKVAGFGVLGQWSLQARRSKAAETGLSYIAPEQIRAPDLLDARSDVWALGLLIHEMLMGVPAFVGASSAGTLAMIAADPPPSISAARADVPRALESVVLRCLEKNPNERYATISEFVRALKPFVSFEAQAKIERIVRISARGSHSVPTFLQSQAALVHLPMARTSTPVSSPPIARPVMPIRALVSLVVAAGALAGVAGALLIVRWWPGLADSHNSSARVQALPPPGGVAVSTQTAATALAGSQPLLAIEQPTSRQRVPSPKGSTPPQPLAIAMRGGPKPAASHAPKVARPTDTEASRAAGNHLFDDIN